MNKRKVSSHKRSKMSASSSRDKTKWFLDGLAWVVNHQAEDEGLWFDAQTGPEKYLQQELRKLHDIIEAGLKVLKS